MTFNGSRVFNYHAVVLVIIPFMQHLLYCAYAKFFSSFLVITCPSYSLKHSADVIFFYSCQESIHVFANQFRCAPSPLRKECVSIDWFSLYFILKKKTFIQSNDALKIHLIRKSNTYVFA